MGGTYVMGVPGADDILRHYQATSCHDALYVQQLLGLRPAPEFEEWRLKMGIFNRDLRRQPAGTVKGLLALYT